MSGYQTCWTGHWLVVSASRLQLHRFERPLPAVRLPASSFQLPASSFRLRPLVRLKPDTTENYTPGATGACAGSYDRFGASHRSASSIDIPLRFAYDSS